MAPSATAAIVPSSPKTQVSEVLEKHVHGAEDKTPLEAISHGPLIQQGVYESLVLYIAAHVRLLYYVVVLSLRYFRKEDALMAAYNRTKVS
jgi:hypothetical protein